MLASQERRLSHCRRRCLLNKLSMHHPSHNQRAMHKAHVYPRAGQRKTHLRYHQPSLFSSSSSIVPYEYAVLNASVRLAYPPSSTTSMAEYDSQGYHIAHAQPQLPRLVMPGCTSGVIGSSTDCSKERSPRGGFFSTFRYAFHHHLPRIQTRAGGGHFRRSDVAPNTHHLPRIQTRTGGGLF